MKFISIILALLIAFSGIDNIFILVSFQLNRQYISQNLCINRDKPALKCNGKCQLSKALKKKQTQEKENNTNTIKSLKSFYTIPNFSLEIVSSIRQIINEKVLFPNISFTKQLYYFAIIHPPD